MRPHIRPAALVDSPRLQELQLLAGAAFHTVGMSEIADNAPTAIAAFDEYAAAGRSWIAEEDGTIVAFVLVDELTTAAHIEQVSVDPTHAGRGIGAGLIDHVQGWAAAKGHTALTLTTFREVPWNAPYYTRLGFTEITADDPESPALAGILADEAAFLDPMTRVAMRRPVTAVGPSPT